MNTNDLNKVKTLVRINPEVEDAVNLVLADVSYRLHNTIGILQDGNQRSNELKRFYEGRRDAYWNIQDLLVKIINT